MYDGKARGRDRTSAGLKYTRKSTLLASKELLSECESRSDEGNEKNRDESDCLFL